MINNQIYLLSRSLIGSIKWSHLIWIESFDNIPLPDHYVLFSLDDILLSHHLVL